MAKKSSPPTRITPLQRVDVEIVTDPVEIARMEEISKNATREFLPIEARLNGSTKEGQARVLKMCRQLTDEQRVVLLTRLEAQSSPRTQLKTLARLLANLSRESLRQLEEELRHTLGQ